MKEERGGDQSGRGGDRTAVRGRGPAGQMPTIHRRAVEGLFIKDSITQTLKTSRLF